MDDEHNCLHDIDLAIAVFDPIYACKFFFGDIFGILSE